MRNIKNKRNQAYNFYYFCYFFKNGKTILNLGGTKCHEPGLWAFLSTLVNLDIHRLIILLLRWGDLRKYKENHWVTGRNYPGIRAEKYVVFLTVKAHYHISNPFGLQTTTKRYQGTSWAMRLTIKLIIIIIISRWYHSRRMKYMTFSLCTLGHELIEFEFSTFPTDNVECTPYNGLIVRDFD